ncbi:MAG: enoyl-CoA hydratase/isomerase family protein [Proteobacteria bacterium]|nr:enoyl-CoA hydratase/isomerase family protein [Pseudomonadota bacterium]
MEDSVLFTIDEDQIAHLTLNRPEVHNAFDNEMIQTITTHLRNLHENSSVRALILTGNGSGFCSGADLAWMERASRFTETENFEDARSLSFMLYFLDTLPIPTLTYAQGTVMGGGIGLIACSDIVLADTSTLFSFSEVKIGLIPAIISPYVLRNIGSHNARRYFLTGEKFNASKALQLGLIHEIVNLEAKDSSINDLKKNLLSASPSAITHSKKLIEQLTSPITDAQRLMTIELIAQMRRSEDGLEGIRSFLNKQPPPWIPERYRND